MIRTPHLRIGFASGAEQSHLVAGIASAISLERTARQIWGIEHYAHSPPGSMAILQCQAHLAQWNKSVVKIHLTCLDDCTHIVSLGFAIKVARKIFAAIFGIDGLPLFYFFLCIHAIYINYVCFCLSGKCKITKQVSKNLAHPPVFLVKIFLLAEKLIPKALFRYSESDIHTLVSLIISSGLLKFTRFSARYSLI